MKYSRVASTLTWAVLAGGAVVLGLSDSRQGMAAEHGRAVLCALNACCKADHFNGVIADADGIGYEYAASKAGCGYGYNYDSAERSPVVADNCPDEEELASASTEEPSNDDDDTPCWEEHKGFAAARNDGADEEMLAAELAGDDDDLALEGNDEVQSERESGYSSEPFEYSYPGGKYGYMLEMEEQSRGNALKAGNDDPEDVCEESFDREPGEPEQPLSQAPTDPSDYEYSLMREKYGYPMEQMEGAPEQPEMRRPNPPAEGVGSEETDGDESQDGWADRSPAPQSQAEAEPAMESGLELFAWLPSELLLLPDEDFLRKLDSVGEESSDVRRAALDDYLQSLGSEALEFVTHFEDATGEDALTLADNLPGSAALLAVYRLYEQGELGMDEASDLLARSLKNLSQEWIDASSAMAADRAEDFPRLSAIPQADAQPTVGPDGQTLWQTVVSQATRSWDQIRKLIRVLPGWVSMATQKGSLAEKPRDRQGDAGQVEAEEDWYQR